MKTSSASGFVNQILVYTLVMIGFSGSMGLGAVWMRHQISTTANSTKQLSARIADVERRLTEATTAAEMERDPNILLQRNSEWRLGLVRPSETQIVRVAEDPVQRLAAKRNSGLFTDGAASISIPVALRR